jgi:tRNA threonylcarbamoyladenosine biosynthesis protein TsaB
MIEQKYIDEMIILSLESSSKSCSAALSQGNKLIAEYSVFGLNIHDKLLAEFAKRLLDDNGITINELSAVAVSAGPGSYTGLRIGAAISKGVCYGGKPKLIAVPTAMALAAAFRYSAIEFGILKIAVLLHSHKELFFRIEYDTELNTIEELNVLSLDELNRTDFSTYLVISNSDISNISAKKLIHTELKASYIANTATILALKDDYVEPESFLPLYGQEFMPKPKSK